MRHEERVFATLVEAVVPGSRMEYRTQQSRGECDFYLHHDLGSFPFEVTVFTDQSREALQAALFGKDGSKDSVSCALTKQHWYIIPTASANIRKLREQADRLLAAIENEALDEFDVNRNTDSPAAQRAWKECGILHGTVIGSSLPARIWVGVPGDAAMLGSDQVIAAVEREAAKADNRRKLRSDVPERHLGVFIGYLGYPAHEAMCSGHFPHSPPVLPSEITHLWTACNAGDAEYMLWSFNRVAGWDDHGLFKL